MKNGIFHIVLFVVLAAVSSNGALAQLSGNLLSEFQRGNIPDVEPGDMSSLYNQINLQYRQKNIWLQTKTEFFQSSFEERNYLQLSQFSFNYQKDSLEVRLGHIYTKLGNGLLFRTYEIPGSIYEDQIYRVRYSFYKDILGAYTYYRHSYFYIKALAGKPLANQLPPTLSFNERHVDQVEAIEAGIPFKSQEFSVIYLRNSATQKISDYASVQLKGKLFKQITYAFEYAARMHKSYTFDPGNENAAYAMYGNFGYSYNQLGVSIEVKDYKNFFIGSGISDPPTLVKEHSSKLLNRKTHVPELNNEKGYQIDVFYFFAGGHLLTFNASRSVNKIIKNYTHFEYYASIDANLFASTTLRVFADYARDDLHREKNIITAGVGTEQELKKGWLISVDVEGQEFTRENFDSRTNRYSNYFYNISFSKSKHFSMSLLLETTTDIFFTDRVHTNEIETTKRYFPGLQATYKLKNKHRIRLFAGSRRGGPACASGICYEELDFKGLELRWTSRF